MQKNSKFLASIFTLTTFVFTQFSVVPGSYAAANIPLSEVPIASVGNFTLPSELGTIESLNLSQGPMIVHIQTAHGNFEAQKNIQGILEFLKKNHGFNTLLLEGSAYPVNPELIRFFPQDMKLTREIAEDLTRRAIFKGADLFMIENPEVKALGIENVDLYRDNGKAFRAVLRQEEATENFVRDMNMQIERLTSPYLNKELRTFLNRLDAYDAKQVPLSDWVNTLKTEAFKRLGIDLADPIQQVKWPMLVRLFTLMNFEAKLDRNALAKEKTDFLKAINRVPKNIYAQVESLLTQPVSRNQLPDPETEILFEKLVENLPANFNYKAYPNVSLFIGHLILQSEIKGMKLMEEVSSLQDTIAERLALTQEEKQILGLLKDHRLLKKLFALQLTPNDYENVLGRANEMKPAQVIARFESLNGSKRVKEVKFSNIENINELYAKALEFYRLVKERDLAMLNNVPARMKEAGVDKAVVITGGFHAEPFRTFANAEGYQYALIAPKISTTEGHEAYVEAVLATGSKDLIKSTYETVFVGVESPALLENQGVDPARILEAILASVKKFKAANIFASTRIAKVLGGDLLGAGAAGLGGRPIVIAPGVTAKVGSLPSNVTAASELRVQARSEVRADISKASGVPVVNADIVEVTTLLKQFLQDAGTNARTPWLLEGIADKDPVYQAWTQKNKRDRSHAWHASSVSNQINVFFKRKEKERKVSPEMRVAVEGLISDLRAVLASYESINFESKDFSRAKLLQSAFLPGANAVYYLEADYAPRDLSEPTTILSYFIVRHPLTGSYFTKNLGSKLSNRTQIRFEVTPKGLVATEMIPRDPFRFVETPILWPDEVFLAELIEENKGKLFTAQNLLEAARRIAARSDARNLISIYESPEAFAKYMIEERMPEFFKARPKVAEYYQAYLKAFQANNADEIKRLVGLIEAETDEFNSLTEAGIFADHLGEFDLNTLDEGPVANVKGYAEYSEKERQAMDDLLIDGGLTAELFGAGEASRLGLGNMFMMSFEQFLKVLSSDRKLDGLTPEKREQYVGILRQQLADYPQYADLPMGARLMLQLRLDIEKRVRAKFANLPENDLKVKVDESLAKQKLSVIVNDAGVDEATALLRAHNFFGFSRENVYFTVQAKFKGVHPTFDARGNLQGFTSDSTAKLVNGHGYPSMQKWFKDEAFYLDKEGTRVVLTESLVDILYQKGTKLLKIFRINDMSNYEFDSTEVEGNALDLPTLVETVKQLGGFENLDNPAVGAAQVVEALDNPKDQKGGLFLATPSLLKRDLGFLTDTLSTKTKAWKEELARISAKNGHGVPYNKMAQVYKLSAILETRNSGAFQGIPAYIRFRGFDANKPFEFAGETVTGDITLSLPAAAVKKPGRDIRDFKTASEFPGLIDRFAKQNQLFVQSAIIFSANPLIAQLGLDGLKGVTVAEEAEVGGEFNGASRLVISLPQVKGKTPKLSIVALNGDLASGWKVISSLETPGQIPVEDELAVLSWKKENGALSAGAQKVEANENPLRGLTFDSANNQLNLQLEFGIFSAVAPSIHRDTAWAPRDPAAFLKTNLRDAFSNKLGDIRDGGINGVTNTDLLNLTVRYQDQVLASIRFRDSNEVIGREVSSAIEEIIRSVKSNNPGLPIYGGQFYVSQSLRSETEYTFEVAFSEDNPVLVSDDLIVSRSEVRGLEAGEGIASQLPRFEEGDLKPFSVQSILALIDDLKFPGQYGNAVQTARTQIKAGNLNAAVLSLRSLAESLKANKARVNISQGDIDRIDALAAEIAQAIARAEVRKPEADVSKVTVEQAIYGIPADFRLDLVIGFDEEEQEVIVRPLILNLSEGRDEIREGTTPSRLKYVIYSSGGTEIGSVLFNATRNGMIDTVTIDIRKTGFEKHVKVLTPWLNALTDESIKNNPKFARAEVREQSVTVNLAPQADVRSFDFPVSFAVQNFIRERNTRGQSVVVTRVSYKDAEKQPAILQVEGNRLYEEQVESIKPGSPVIEIFFRSEVRIAAVPVAEEAAPLEISAARLTVIREFLANILPLSIFNSLLRSGTSAVLEAVSYVTGRPLISEEDREAEKTLDAQLGSARVTILAPGRESFITVSDLKTTDSATTVTSGKVFLQQAVLESMGKNPDALRLLLEGFRDAQFESRSQKPVLSVVSPDNLSKENISRTVRSALAQAGVIISSEQDALLEAIEFIALEKGKAESEVVNEAVKEYEGAVSYLGTGEIPGLDTPAVFAFDLAQLSRRPSFFAGAALVALSLNRLNKAIHGKDLTPEIRATKLDEFVAKSLDNAVEKKGNVFMLNLTRIIQTFLTKRYIETQA